MVPNTLKIDITHQDKNDKMDVVSLYSHKKFYVSVMPFLMLFSVISTLIHYDITLYYVRIWKSYYE